MKIGFTAKGTDWDAMIDARFGRARYLIVYDDTADELKVHDNKANSEQTHGAGPGTAKKLFEMQADILAERVDLAERRAEPRRHAGRGRVGRQVAGGSRGGDLGIRFSMLVTRQQGNGGAGGGSSIECHARARL